MNKKSVILLSAAIVIFLSWFAYDKYSSTIKQNKLQSKINKMEYIVDSLEVYIDKRDSIIEELNRTDIYLNYQLMHQKEKVVIITKWIDSSRARVDTYTEKELISSFNKRYPKDTTTNLLPLAQPVLVNAAKDLIELEGIKQEIVVKDSMIVLCQAKNTTKDSIVSQLNDKIVGYKSTDSLKTKQIESYKDQNELLKTENSKIKKENRTKIIKIVVSAVASIVTSILLK